MWAGTLFGVYANEHRELVVEIAVPGREGEDLDIRVNDDDTVCVHMPAKSDAPGSLLAMSISVPVTDISHRWNVEQMRAVCRHGLLTLVFPPKNPAVPLSVAPQQGSVRPGPDRDPRVRFRNRFEGLN